MKITNRKFRKLKDIIREIIEESNSEITNWQIETPIIIDTYEFDNYNDDMDYESSAKLLTVQSKKFNNFINELLELLSKDTTLPKLLDKAFPNDGIEYSIEDIDGVSTLVIKTNPKVDMNIQMAEKSLKPLIIELNESYQDYIDPFDYKFEDGNYIYTPRIWADTFKDSKADDLETYSIDDIEIHSIITEE